MKWIIRLFFRTLRRILGPIMLLLDKITSPRGVIRGQEEQQKIDQHTRNIALYQYKTCPFCIRVRREIKRQSLNVELRDAQNDYFFRDELINEGGKLQVPCLKIHNENGENTWIYESSDVIAYLRKVIA